MAKMRKCVTFRLLCVILCVMFASLTAGCGKSASTSDSGITKLKMILVGEKPEIYDEIYGKLNEMLREDIGAELEIEYFNFSDVSQKYSLLFSSNEQFDIVFSARWLQYNQQASKNSFMEITDDMLKEYAPKTYESLPENAKNEAKVNGKMYMIPNTAQEYATGVALVRGDLRKKYNLDEIENTDDMENYLQTIADNEDSFIALCDVTKAMELFTEGANGVFRVAPSGLTGIKYEYPSDKLIKSVFSDIYLERANKIRDFVDRGIIPADIIANKTVDNMFENGKAATYFNNLETAASLAKKLRASHPEWEVELCDLTGDQPQIANSYISNGLSLNRTTKNYGKALQLIDLLRNDKRYFDLTWYGIEGKHWEAEGDNSYRSLNESLDAKEQYSPGCVWGWKNQDMLRTDVDDIPEKQEILEKWIQNTVDVPINGFNFDDSNVKTEIASVTNVDSQYGTPLENGLYEKSRISEEVENYRNKLEQAGIDKLYEEASKQYKEYLKSLE